MTASLGLYLAIPFCKAKCSFCNFASGVFAPERMRVYVDRVCSELRQTRAWARHLGADMPDRVDSIYLGGGTPSLLKPDLIHEMFRSIHNEFEVERGSEVTVECAPGQIAEATLDALQDAGVNRVSLGVQSFVDRESATVGRMHTAADCHAEIRRLQRAGVRRLALDLIVGLPHQTRESWRESMDAALSTGVEHLSVYALEVDEDSRLGQEALAGGKRYGASCLPEDDCVAEWFAAAREQMTSEGVDQYEISNFARAGACSRHNRKYWQRDPYLGFGLDAHSMLPTGNGAVRWANPDDMRAYEEHGLIQLSGGESGFPGRTVDRVGPTEAFEESLFLGLRLTEGVHLDSLRLQFGSVLVDGIAGALEDVESAGLLSRAGGHIQLTMRGQMISNEVFSRLLVENRGNLGRT